MQLWEIFRHCAGIFSSAMQYLRPTCLALARCHPSLQKKHLSCVDSFTPATPAPMSNSDAQPYRSRAVLQHPDITGETPVASLVMHFSFSWDISSTMHSCYRSQHGTDTLMCPVFRDWRNRLGGYYMLVVLTHFLVLFSLRQSGNTKACLLRAQYLEVLDFDHTGRLPP